MKEYEFEVQATLTYYGVVTAESEEQAKEKCINNDYDDIIDYYDNIYHWDTFKITRELEIKKN